MIFILSNIYITVNNKNNIDNDKFWFYIPIIKNLETNKYYWDTKKIKLYLNQFSSFSVEQLISDYTFLKNDSKSFQTNIQIVYTHAFF